MAYQLADRPCRRCRRRTLHARDALESPRRGLVWLARLANLLLCPWECQEPGCNRRIP